MFKVAATLTTLAQAGTIAQPASSVCVTNYANDTVTWFMQNEEFQQVSANVTISAGNTTCENMSTFIDGGATQNKDYPSLMTYAGQALFPIYAPLPYAEYEPSAGSMTFACAVDWESMLCCCVPGNSPWICQWEKGSYSKCVLPPAASVQELE